MSYLYPALWAKAVPLQKPAEHGKGHRVGNEQVAGSPFELAIADTVAASELPRE